MYVLPHYDLSQQLAPICEVGGDGRNNPRRIRLHFLKHPNTLFLNRDAHVVSVFDPRNLEGDPHLDRRHHATDFGNLIVQIDDERGEHLGMKETGHLYRVRMDGAIGWECEVLLKNGL